ncbi:putative serine incorporator/TMS membrane protein [Monocercomonoides exilis]|uniref:putative serine incorporator/TMS membrane protein n=1 Tax=Monocercomonoides exilis TaxID=2049356 RepID=UPI00355A11A4|nr:putative serine incorporator/TMS membrane protein [Monocercomonoides exilis]|eukprot:MONOS_2970.1-p1 / transcript=MONOS_2970.1 / gene=MONOS_2970 / organism=Monocercomonoides_exilis_PA203 / gene_product=YALI0A09064p / transcript_product=YALI0A09064p / location=Mono_scaffold00065:120855-122780(-) / protein_length=464 / sequence_SO=supercontig / SO=protein_coding / is_pseudo=false
MCCCCIGSAIGSACASCCCSCCTSKKSTSLAARFGSLLLLSVGAICVLVFSFWGYEIFHNKPYDADVGGCIGQIDTCSEKLLVLRVGVALCIVFIAMFLMSLVLCGTQNSICISIQNEWWPIKLLVLIVALVGCYFISPKATVVLFYFEVVGSAFFLVMQIVLLIDFFMSWNEKWLEKGWEKCLAFLTISGLVGYLALIILTFVFYSKCALDIIFTVITLVVGICLMILSLRIPTASVFTTTLVMLYCGWLNLSSLMANPNDKCFTFANHVSSDAAGGVTMKIISLAFLYLALIYSTFTSSGQVAEENEGKGSYEMTNGTSSSGSTEYKRPSATSTSDQSTSSSNSSSANSSSLENEDPLYAHLREEAESTSSLSRRKGNGRDVKTFPYWKMYLVFILASCHLCVVVVGWSVTDRNALSGMSVGISIASLWSKTIANWTCAVLYLWLVLAPVIGPKLFPNRTWE